MKFIKFGKFDKKLIIPIIGGICRLTFNFFYKKNPKYGILSQNPFIASIYSSIGMILAFIPYLILKHRSESPQFNSIEFSNTSKLNLTLIHIPINKKINRNRYIFIIFQAIFDFLQTVFYMFFCMNNIYNFWTFDIIFISIFSCLLLKTKLYRHQYISMIIILILGFILNILEHLKQNNTDNTIGFLEIFMIILCEIFLSMIMVIAKYNMEKTFCSPYEICIWVGSIGLISYIIFLLIINLLGLEIAGIKHPDNFFNLFNHYDIYDFLLCLSYLVGQAIYNIVLLVTCNYFTPSHILIIAIFKEIYNSLSFEENIGLNLLTFSILILIAFMFLAFIEVIELNICNISFNTKNNIQLRSLSEYIEENSNIINPNDETSNTEDELSLY